MILSLQSSLVSKCLLDKELARKEYSKVMAGHLGTR